VIALRDAGVHTVQLDDPHLCLFVDPAVRAQYDNPEKAKDFAVDMVNQVVDGFSDLKLAVHLCRRAGARVRGEATHAGGYDEIIRQLNRLEVNHLTMEFTAPEAGDLSVLRKLREDFEVGLGCVSCEPGRIDSADDVYARVKMALNHLAPERVTLNPDCGFAPGSAARVSIDEVYRKLKNEVEAAGACAPTTPELHARLRFPGAAWPNAHAESPLKRCSTPIGARSGGSDSEVNRYHTLHVTGARRRTRLHDR
jgi:5-methyltetrahydropteroyltriglutamate--homocysteine methyltransferase